MNTKKLHTFHVKHIVLILLGLLSYFTLYQVAHAAYTTPFIISAYYSPLEGQSRYVTGSYAGDIRLNGSGVKSADGTPVYPGMIAAPSTYAFGTKMNIPGIGTVAVHDRGGAIVTAGNRGHAYDRLDVWMGYGDAGLTRALNWGKRTVSVTVYGQDPYIEENVYLEGFSQAEKIIRDIVVEQKIFKTDMGYGSTGDKVGELERYLTELGYYKGEIDNYYGDEVYKAVIAFQIDQNILDKEEDFGSGYFGPQTRAKIEAVLENRKKENLPRKNLGKDDNGDEVKKLQEALKKLGYDLEISGIYDDKTIDAVFEFQKNQEIVDHVDDLGAGYFGPRTFTVLSQKLAELDETSVEPVQEATIAQTPFESFDNTLSLGDKGDHVTRLQEDLKKFNLLNIEPTGYYGEVTQHAVYKFQQRKGLVASINDSGAGVFGPQTRNAFNNILGYRANTKAIIASKTASYNNKDEEPKMLAQEIFKSELGIGSRGKEVQILQESLKKLGFYQGSITSEYYGEITKNAVIAFQIDKGLIASEYDSGAGHLGPQTRKILNTVL